MKLSFRKEPGPFRDKTEIFLEFDHVDLKSRGEHKGEGVVVILKGGSAFVSYHCKIHVYFQTAYTMSGWFASKGEEPNDQTILTINGQSVLLTVSNSSKHMRLPRSAHVCTCVS